MSQNLFISLIMAIQTRLFHLFGLCWIIVTAIDTNLTEGRDITQDEPCDFGLTSHLKCYNEPQVLRLIYIDYFTSCQHLNRGIGVRRRGVDIMSIRPNYTFILGSSP